MKRPTIDPRKRQELIDKYILALEKEIYDGDMESERTLKLYRFIDRLGSGISKDDRFHFLACSNLQIKAECPLGHYKEDRYFHYCRRRYWCSSCLHHALQTQQQRWMNLIRSNIATTEFMHLGPLVRLEWAIPNPLSLDDFKSFTHYMRRTFPEKLCAAGVPENSWMMMRAYDPIVGKIRAVYLGPSADWSMVCENRKRSTKTSTGILTAYELDYICNKYASTRTRSEGQPSPWKPKRIGKREYLSDTWCQYQLPHTHAIEFWNRIEKAVSWAVGSVTPMTRMDPAKALKLHRLYRKQRLFATYGQIYSCKVLSAFPDDMDTERENLIVEYLMANKKSFGLEFHNSMMMAGYATSGIQTAPADQNVSPHDQHDVIQVGQCPECNRTLVLKVSDSGYRRKRQPIQ